VARGRPTILADEVSPALAKHPRRESGSTGGGKLGGGGG